jgi:3-oxoacyl-[acyl-carrier-protein] synthase II
VTALKGYIGNLVSGAGAVELICSLVGANRGEVPAVLNCDQPDSGIELDLVQKMPRESKGPVFVNTSVTPHGQAAAVVVRACPSSGSSAI